MLEIRDIEASYGHLQVLWKVSLDVGEGEFVTLVGPNGAGKTTTLRAISSLIHPWSGTIKFLGESIVDVPPHLISQRGIRFITEELDLFEQMSVHENLLLGAYGIRDKKMIDKSISFILDLFPRLAERSKQLAGTLSGGERKMLAIARGLVSNPKLILVDEPSLGLAPLLVENVFSALKELHSHGMTILLVEQNVGTALKMTERSYVLEQGRVVMAGPSSELLVDEHIKSMYLGL